MSEVEFPELDWKVDVTNLPRAGAEFWFEASDVQCRQLLEPLGLMSLDRFVVRVKVNPRKKRCFYVTGSLEAELVQSCVVTLNPVPANISADFDRLLIAQENSNDDKVERLVPREVVVDPIEDDPPDIFDGSAIDIGLISLEEIALLIDPYPRHPSAGDWLNEEYASSDSHTSEDTKPDNPFAALSKLKSE